MSTSAKKAAVFKMLNSAWRAGESAAETEKSSENSAVKLGYSPSSAGRAARALAGSAAATAAPTPPRTTVRRLTPCEPLLSKRPTTEPLTNRLDGSRKTHGHLLPPQVFRFDHDGRDVVAHALGADPARANRPVFPS